MFDCEFCCFLLSCRPLLSFFFSFKFLCGLRFAFSALCDACVVLVEYQSDYVVVEVFKGMVVYGGGLRLSVCFWVGVGKLDGTIIGG